MKLTFDFTEDDYKYIVELLQSINNPKEVALIQLLKDEPITFRRFCVVCGGAFHTSDINRDWCSNGCRLSTKLIN